MRLYARPGVCMNHIPASSMTRQTGPRKQDLYGERNDDYQDKGIDNPPFAASIYPNPREYSSLPAKKTILMSFPLEIRCMVYELFFETQFVEYDTTFIRRIEDYAFSPPETTLLS